MHLVMHREHFHSQDFDFGLLGGGGAHLHASPSPRCALRSCDLPIPAQMHHFSPTQQETFVFNGFMQSQQREMFTFGITLNRCSIGPPGEKEMDIFDNTIGCTGFSLGRGEEGG